MRAICPTCKSEVALKGEQVPEFAMRSQQPTQPAPDGGEWCVECQLVKVADPPRGRVVIKDVKTLRIITCEDNPSRWDQALVDFGQIVADHNAIAFARRSGSKWTLIDWQNWLQWHVKGESDAR